MKIKLKLNNDTLLACRKLLNKIYDSEIPTTEAGKLIKSICLDTPKKKHSNFSIVFIYSLFLVLIKVRRSQHKPQLFFHKFQMLLKL